MTARTPLVGYYVHHQGRGHLHRALALGRALARHGLRTDFLSSHGRPDELPPGAGWVQLARDDDGSPVEPSPGGLLHWAPRGHGGQRERMARISRWIDTERPGLLVSDVSQEVTALARLHGVPVLSVVLPGDRGDAPHRLGLGVSERTVGFWPPEATRMVSGLSAHVAGSLVPVGALSRYAPIAAGSTARADRLLVLSGRGGDAWSAEQVDRLAARARGWRVEVLGPDHWVNDPWPHLLAADLVVTRAGQASIAEVAAARVPAVVVPARRPHDEQAHTAAQLDRGFAGGVWPARVCAHLDAVGSSDLAAASALDGAGWASWCDGGAADRFVAVVRGLLAPSPRVLDRCAAP